MKTGRGMAMIQLLRFHVPMKAQLYGVNDHRCDADHNPIIAARRREGLSPT